MALISVAQMNSNPNLHTEPNLKLKRSSNCKRKPLLSLSKFLTSTCLALQHCFSRSPPCQIEENLSYLCVTCIDAKLTHLTEMSYFDMGRANFARPLLDNATQHKDNTNIFELPRTTEIVWYARHLDWCNMRDFLDLETQNA